MEIVDFYFENEKYKPCKVEQGQQQKHIHKNCHPVRASRSKKEKIMTKEISKNKEAAQQRKDRPKNKNLKTWEKMAR
jgi:hypothetical protein